MSKHVVVVGAGFGGMAEAIRLRARGFRVTLVEKRENLGGRAYQLKRSGYTFDMGPSLITAPFIIDQVFRAANRSLKDYVDLIRLDPFYRVYFHDGFWVDYTGDSLRMKARMAELSPRDADRYDDFFRDIGRIYDAVITEGLGAQPFVTLRSYLRFGPRALRLGALRPVYSFAARYFKHEWHRFLFSFHPLFIGGSPFRAPSVYIMIPYLEREGGVWFAKGGMYRLVEAFGRLFREMGGEVRTGKTVEEVLVAEGRAVGVRLADGKIEADAVVCNADIPNVYQNLIAPKWRRKWTDRAIAKLHMTMSCFLLYLGVRKRYFVSVQSVIASEAKQSRGIASVATLPRNDEGVAERLRYFKLRHHTLVLGPRYRELVRDLFDRKIIPRDFSLYLHVPTSTDPSMAPPGCESVMVLAPVPHLGSAVDWKREAEPYKAKILDHLEYGFGLEGLQDHLEICEMFTPLDFRDQLDAYLGNAFGIEPRLSQSAYLRPHNRSEDVKGLYFVGAGTHPGGGIPGVLMSAEVTEKLILEDFAKNGKFFKPQGH